MSNPKLLSNFWYYFFAMPVFTFNSLPNGEYSNLFIVAAFSNQSFSGKTSLPYKNSYLLTSPDDKAEILAVCLSKSYWDLFCTILLSIALISLLYSFYNKLFLNLNGLSDDKVVLFTKNRNGSLVYSL